MFFISSKKLFSYIQICVFSPSPLFLPDKKNLKVYDVINRLNKNLITHFVWHLEKEIRCDIETLSIDRVLNKEHFIEKSCRKCAPKASPRSLFNIAK